MAEVSNAIVNGFCLALYILLCFGRRFKQLRSLQVEVYYGEASRANNYKKIEISFTSNETVL